MPEQERHWDGGSERRLRPLPAVAVSTVFAACFAVIATVSPFTAALAQAQLAVERPDNAANIQCRTACFPQRRTHGIHAMAFAGPVSLPVRLRIADDEAPISDMAEAQELLLTHGQAEAARAAEIYRMSAEQENPLAEYDLGYLYEHGIGVGRDVVRALGLYRRALTHARDVDLRALAAAAIDHLEDSSDQTAPRARLSAQNTSMENGRTATDALPSATAYVAAADVATPAAPSADAEGASPSPTLLQTVADQSPPPAPAAASPEAAAPAAAASETPSPDTAAAASSAPAAATPTAASTLPASAPVAATAEAPAASPMATVEEKTVVSAVPTAAAPPPASPTPASETIVAAPPLPADAGKPPVVSETPATASPSIAPLPPALIASLLNRGNEMLRIGDIGAARLLLERAANSGSAQAALGLGKTHDPRYLAQAHAIGIAADPATAADWYRKAASLGDHDAARLLAGLATLAAQTTGQTTTK